MLAFLLPSVSAIRQCCPRTCEASSIRRVTHKPFTVHLSLWRRQLRILSISEHSYFLELLVNNLTPKLMPVFSVARRTSVYEISLTSLYTRSAVRLSPSTIRVIRPRTKLLMDDHYTPSLENLTLRAFLVSCVHPPAICLSVALVPCVKTNWTYQVVFYRAMHYSA